MLESTFGRYFLADFMGVEVTWGIGSGCGAAVPTLNSSDTSALSNG